VKALGLARWSPYVVGVLIGVLSWITFATMEKALGTSTSIVQAAGAAERVVAPDHVAENAYYGKYLGTPEKPKPWFEWQFALVLMLPVGAFVAARLSKSQIREDVPEVWQARFGPSKAKRWAVAFGGGAIMLFGARMAGGCTSGHALSGGLQLAVSSWIFTGALFAAGVGTAWAVYGRKGADHV